VIVGPVAPSFTCCSLSDAEATVVSVLSQSTRVPRYVDMIARNRVFLPPCRL